MQPNLKYMTQNDCASSNLLGKKIDDWEINGAINVPSNLVARGITDYALFYTVGDAVGNEYVMKVLDVYKCYTHPLLANQRRSALIEEAIRDFRYEAALAEHCNEAKLSRLVTYISSGEIEIDDFPQPLVCYIVYEKSNGTVLDVLDFSEKITLTESLQTAAEKLKMLHDVATGVNQLHKIKVSHQDLSPSKILSVGENFKLGDLSRALCLNPELGCPFSLDDFNGRDYTYAPPEVIFNCKLEKEEERIYQVDNYMIGSLLVFYLTGVSYNVLLNNHLPRSMREMMCSGLSFEEVKTYLKGAHAEALLELKEDISIEEIQDGVVEIVKYLCEPDPGHRGHPKVVGEKCKVSHYDLVRTIAHLDLLSRKAELALLK